MLNQGEKFRDFHSHNESLSRILKIFQLNRNSWDEFGFSRFFCLFDFYFIIKDISFIFDIPIVTWRIPTQAWFTSWKRKPFCKFSNYSFFSIYKHYLDKTMRYPLQRWIIWFVLLAYYGYRIYTCQGFYLITYALGLYILNLFLGFVSPLVPILLVFLMFHRRIQNSMMTMKEIYCLLRRLMNSSPSFVVFQSSPSGMHFPSSLFSRYESIKMILMSLLMTFNKAFDVPVFWPILVVYFLVFLLHFRLYLF